MLREELNRDITFWYCRSLRSFEYIEHETTVDFFAKIFPTISLPCRSTFSGAGLNDVYLAVKGIIKSELQKVKVACNRDIRRLDRSLSMQELCWYMNSLCS